MNHGVSGKIKSPYTICGGPRLLSRKLNSLAPTTAQIKCFFFYKILWNYKQYSSGGEDDDYMLKCTFFPFGNNLVEKSWFSLHELKL